MIKYKRSSFTNGPTGDWYISNAKQTLGIPSDATILGVTLVQTNYTASETNGYVSYNSADDTIVVHYLAAYKAYTCCVLYI